MAAVIAFEKGVSDADMAIEGDARAPEIDTSDEYEILPVESKLSGEVDVVVYKLLTIETGEADEAGGPPLNGGATEDSTLGDIISPVVAPDEIPEDPVDTTFELYIVFDDWKESEAAVSTEVSPEVSPFVEPIDTEGSLTTKLEAEY